AIELFQAVPRDNEFYIKAKFFEGVTYVRKNDGKPATEAFKEILTIAAEPTLRKNYKKEDVRDYEELANLSMARVFYTTKNYDTAIKYFERVPQESPWWLTSLFEASWAYFLKNGYSKALGNVHTMSAPYFENEFDSYFAEAVNLRAIMYYNYCRYDRAEEA